MIVMITVVIFKDVGESVQYRMEKANSGHRQWRLV